MSYYVYAHSRLTDGSVFYIGQGKNKRAWSKSGRNVHWHRIVKKNGYSVHVLIEGLSQECALSIERAVIRHYGRDTLCNLTDGGDIGPTGMKHSPETVRAQSERLRGNKHTLGRKLSEEHKRKISEWGKGRKHSEETRAKLRGRTPSPETRAKLSASLRGRKLSEEHVRKISERMKGNVPSEETRARLSASLKGKLAGEKNPAYGIPKTDAQKARLREAMLGRKFSAETIAKRSGKNHPRYDATLYTLTHDEHGTVTETRHYFKEHFQMDKVRDLVTGRRKSYRGWRLTGIPT